MDGYDRQIDSPSDFNRCDIHIIFPRNTKPCPQKSQNARKQYRCERSKSNYHQPPKVILKKGMPQFIPVDSFPSESLPGSTCPRGPSTWRPIHRFRPVRPHHHLPQYSSRSPRHWGRCDGRYSLPERSAISSPVDGGRVRPHTVPGQWSICQVESTWLLR